MRVQLGRPLRVQLGDTVVIRGRLPADAKLARLFVFASEAGADFSPYVPNVADVIYDRGRPAMMRPMSMRLMSGQPVRELTFVSDIDGFVCVVQEIDTPTDLKAKIQMVRRINPDLGWIERLQRKFNSWQTPRHS